MRSLFKVVLIFSLPCATLLSFPLAQAKVPGQVCQALLDSERSQVKWYPVKPLPETIATDVVARQLDELEAIATSPTFLNLAIQTQLTPWLFEKPDTGKLISIVKMYTQAGRIDSALKMISLLSPSYTALRQELQQYVNCYNSSSQFLRR
ncbi:hypothetical protein NIES2101_30335 [Calothrix sp. HK-06]|nr:hypothetical protein NIES2101_30335 [Calothrix sp. HK-06]